MRNRLYQLKPILRSDGWPMFESNIAVLVRAPSEDVARVLAGECAEREGEQAWLSPHVTTCEEVPVEGDVGVVLVSSTCD